MVVLQLCGFSQDVMLVLSAIIQISVSALSVLSISVEI
jgi:hypothetical protein